MGRQRSLSDGILDVLQLELLDEISKGKSEKASYGSSNSEADSDETALPERWSSCDAEQFDSDLEKRAEEDAETICSLSGAEPDDAWNIATAESWQPIFIPVIGVKPAELKRQRPRGVRGGRRKTGKK